MARLSIKQAVSYTGKSENTIRRLLKKYSLGTHENARYFRKIKGKYYIDKQFLKEHYNVAEEEPQQQLDLSLVQHLKEQNIELNARVKELTHVVAHQSQIIANKDEQLRQLSAAPRESENDKSNLYFVILMVVVFIVIGIITSILLRL